MYHLYTTGGPTGVWSPRVSLTVGLGVRMQLRPSSRFTGIYKLRVLSRIFYLGEKFQGELPRGVLGHAWKCLE